MLKQSHVFVLSLYMTIWQLAEVCANPTFSLVQIQLDVQMQTSQLPGKGKMQEGKIISLTADVLESDN